MSKTTVSYVLNATPKQSIPEETRQRVLEAVRQLNYVPLSAARDLRRGRNNTVLLVVPDWPLGRVLALIIDELTTALEARGLALLLRRQRPTQTLSSMWREVSPVAVVAFKEVDDADEEAIRDAGIFVASALLTAPLHQSDAVVVPQDLIGSLQAQHLAATGHRRIAYAAPRDPRFRAFVDLRVEGARRSCLDLGLEEPQIVELDLTLDGAVAAVQGWRDRADPVSGVMAYNDEFAGALTAGLRHLGLSAPGDLAVIGVDNEPLGRFTSPSLTTVDQNHLVVAEHLAEMVAKGIAGEPVSRPPRFDALTVVVRESA